MGIRELRTVLVASRFDGWVAPVEDAIAEIERLRKALKQIADLGQDDESCAGFIAYKALDVTQDALENK